MKITLETLDKYIEEMLSVLSEYYESTDEFKDRYSNNKQNIIPELVDYCIGKFVQTELDYQTDGDRGMGRMSNFVPRLGGYFRKNFLSLNSNKKLLLEEKIAKIKSDTEKYKADTSLKIAKENRNKFDSKMA